MAERKVVPVRVDDALLAAVDQTKDTEELPNRSEAARVLLSWAVLTMKPGWRPGEQLPAYLDRLSRAELVARSKVKGRPAK